MKTSTAITLLSLAVTAACLTVSFIRTSKPNVNTVITDTVTVVRTDTIIETRHIESIVTKVVRDTVIMTTVENDTVIVPVPIEHKYERYDDALVLYHGYMAGIDSLVLYPKVETRYISERTVQTKERPFIIGPSLTAGLSPEGKLEVIPGISLTFNIKSLKSIGK